MHSRTAFVTGIVVCIFLYMWLKRQNRRMTHRVMAKKSTMSEAELVKQGRGDGFDVQVLHSGSDDVCMAMVCIGEEYTKDIEKYTLSKLEYAKRHNYTFVCLKSPSKYMLEHTSNKHASWSKLPFVEWLLSYFEVVCMIDADIYVTNPNVSIDKLLSEETDISIQKTTYNGHDTVLQSSTVLFRPSARPLIRRAWQKSVVDGPRPKFPGLAYDDWGEQTHLQREIEANEDQLVVTFKYMSCLTSDHDCQRQFPFWHMAGSNHKGKLDELLSKRM